MEIELEKVAQRYYGFDIAIPNKEALVNQYWPTTDDILYKDARQSYLDITLPFSMPPKVYKFNSTREKVWKESSIQIAREKKLAEFAKRMKEYDDAVALIRNSKFAQNAKMPKKPVFVEEVAIVEPPKIIDEMAPSSHIAKKGGRSFNVRGVEVTNDPHGSYFNPFDVPKPWITKRTLNGVYYYINELTNERKDVHPGMLWETKYDKIKKLTRNDDMTGYEYVEDMDERKKRLELMTTYEKKLIDEIRRRVNEPTDIEIVEDVLFEMVEKIHKDDEVKHLTKRLERVEKKRSVWNVSTKGYRMVSLGVNETEDGTIIQLITDIDFTDMIISEFGSMLSLSAPTGLFLKFAEEREAIRLDNEAKLKLKQDQYDSTLAKLSVKGGRPGDTAMDNARLVFAMGLNGK